MDFHKISRRKLQALCKRNGVRANVTNDAMIKALEGLSSVDGIEEIGTNSPGTSVMKLAAKAAVISGDEQQIWSPFSRGRSTTRRMGAAPTPIWTPVHATTRTPHKSKEVAPTPTTLRRSQRLAASKATAADSWAVDGEKGAPCASPARDEEAALALESARSLILRSRRRLSDISAAGYDSNVKVSVADSNNLELGRLKKELCQKDMKIERLEQALCRESDQLRNVSQKYENDKKSWAAAIPILERKIKGLKQAHIGLNHEVRECANAFPELSKIKSVVQDLVAQRECLKFKYNKELDKNRKLHNIVQETKGNIRVFCRCRPLSKDETSSSKKSVVDFNGANDGEIMVTVTETTKKTFKFDRVFTPKDGQGFIYADVSPLVTSVLDGYNVCIFAYGQTGSGKTFTMEGTESDRGVNYKSLEELFKIVNEREATYKYDLSVSILEVYNEQIRDLLATPSSKNLEIKLDRDKSPHVPGLTDANVKDINEVWNILQTGSNARAVGSNNVNTHSSRSHCMICIKVRAKNDLNGECTSSKLWLVDLAGSERLTKTDAQGEQLNEAKYINRSLSELHGVISALAMKNSHIPYRNSKLTHLLQDSLGGNSKALMLVQISPSESDASETLMSLNFASCLCHIELGPAKKQVHSAQLQNTRQMLEETKQEVRKLEKDLQNLKSKAKGDKQLCKDLQEKVKELEGRLDSKAHSQITSEKQQRLLSGKLKEKEQEHQPSIVEQKNKVLERKLKEQEHQRSAEAICEHNHIMRSSSLLVRRRPSPRLATAATHKVAPDSRVPRQQPGRDKMRRWVG